jgi:hypothetical protein
MEEFLTKFPPVRDQGQRNTCVSFSLTFLNEQLRNFSMDLSVEFLHWTTKRRYNATKTGVNPDTACDVVVSTGQPIESTWPYDPTLDENAAGYAAPVSATNARKYRASAFSNPAIPTFEQMESVLESNGPFALGIELWSPFFFPVKGYIQTPDPQKDQFLGLHLVCAVETRTHESTNQRALLVRNSWGNRWGIEGYGYLSKEYVTRHARAVWQLLGVPEHG